MSQTLFLLLVFGPPVGLGLSFMAWLMFWHLRLNSGAVDTATRTKITRRCKLFASVLKKLGWVYVLVFILLGVLRYALHHE